MLEPSDSTQSTVTLLSKYNLNLEGVEQATDAPCIDTQCRFASSKYWSSAYAGYTDWDNKYFDINNVDGGNVFGYVMYKAKQYAIEKGGTGGRLLTYEEANALKTSYGDMIYGKANRQGKNSNDYYLIYWLSSGDQRYDHVIFTVNGNTEELKSCNYANDGIGIRPVMTVSKSLVRPVTNETPYEVYTLGQEVTVGGDNFFVIEEYDSTIKSTIKLISKYNLSATANVQSNIDSYDTYIKFSNDDGDAYWKNIEGITYPYDLNKVESATAAAYNKAKAYGESKGGIGRLIRSTEAQPLVSSGKIPDIMYGKNYETNSTAKNYLNYWTSTAYNYMCVYCVYRIWK